MNNWIRHAYFLAITPTCFQLLCRLLAATVKQFVNSFFCRFVCAGYGEGNRGNAEGNGCAHRRHVRLRGGHQKLDNFVECHSLSRMCLYCGNARKWYDTPHYPCSFSVLHISIQCICTYLHSWEFVSSCQTFWHGSVHHFVPINPSAPNPPEQCPGSFWG